MGVREWSLIFFLSLALAFSHNGYAYDGSLKKRVCNGKKYQDDAYECAVNHAIDAILKYTKQHPTYTYFYGGNCFYSVHYPYVYGYGLCRKELSYNDCGNCIISAKDILFQECTDRVGAQVKLQDCGIRYESYKFMD